MRTLRRFLPLIVLLAIGGALYFGYRRLAARPPLIEVSEARTESAVRVLAVTGRVRPRLASRIQSLVSGTVLTLTREEGDAVRRGELCSLRLRHSVDTDELVVAVLRDSKQSVVFAFNSTPPAAIRQARLW